MMGLHLHVSSPCSSTVLRGFVSFLPSEDVEGAVVCSAGKCVPWRTSEGHDTCSLKGVRLGLSVVERSNLDLLLWWWSVLGCCTRALWDPGVGSVPSDMCCWCSHACLRAEGWGGLPGGLLGSAYSQAAPLCD
jgi:hypothetical protein